MKFLLLISALLTGNLPLSSSYASPKKTNKLVASGEYVDLQEFTGRVTCGTDKSRSFFKMSEEQFLKSAYAGIGACRLYRSDSFANYCPFYVKVDGIAVENPKGGPCIKSENEGMTIIKDLILDGSCY